jgi:hypothetical protein
VRRTVRTGMAVLVAVGLLAACSDDDDAAQETTTTEAAPADDGGEGEAVACQPVGSGGTPVPVVLDEWSVTPEVDTTAPGSVRVVAANEGEEPHELVVVRAASPADLTVEAGQVDEGALAEGDFLGEIEAFPAGESCEGTFDLTPGSYVLFCNIVEQEDGELESHFELGMQATLLVQ